MFKFVRYLFTAPLYSFPLLAQQAPVASPPAAAHPVAPQPAAIHPMAQSADVQYDEKSDVENKDMDALRRWLRDKRLVSVKEIGGDLSLSGEVRTEFQAANQLVDGVQQYNNPDLAPNFPKVRPQYAWDVEVNIMIDYRTDRTWAAIKLEFDNDMGLRSGTMNNIKLEKAYLGGRIIAGDTFTTDAEIGRRFLFNVFESKIEFSALYDGMLVRMSKAFANLGDYYFNAGAFLVNDITNHYGFISEMGALRIANIGVNVKYSLIDWYKPGGENEQGQTAEETRLADIRFKYLVSQLLVYYQYYPEWIGKRMIKVYGAALTNHLAHGVEQTGNERQNWGWYAGVSIGVAKKAGDWAIDANYQWVQAQTVPDYDVLGIGRGNVAKVGLYTNNIDGSGGETTQATAVGNCNYKGFELEGLYALTNNLVVQQTFRYSTTLNKNIGPNIRYKQYEIEFIYAF
ncbi:MAG TPA: hypothetical protein VLE89_06290 [Chlamydiales bacterium]|nr:hypothetical protein [Chlamydiales bacterium]